MTMIDDRGTVIMDCIRGYLERHPYPPSIREIALETGIPSTSMVVYWLRKLRAQGVVTWEEGKNRTLQVLGEE